jgi:hypothetical protein
VRIVVRDTFPTLGKRKKRFATLSRHWESGKNGSGWFPDVGKVRIVVRDGFPALGKWKKRFEMVSQRGGRAKMENGERGKTVLRSPIIY